MHDGKIAKNSPSAHHRTNLSSYIFATKVYIDNRKKNLLNSNTSSRCRHNMVNFGLLTAEIGWWVWGTPANFNGFRVLAIGFVTARTSLIGGQPNHARCLAVSWAGTLYTFSGVLAPEGILPGAQFTLRTSLALSYIGSVTARHSTSGRQLKFAACYKEWNFRTGCHLYSARQPSLWASTNILVKI